MKNGEITNLIANIEIIAAEVRETFGGLSKEQLNWKPDDDTWSIGQCFDHLITANEQYFERIQKVIDGTHENNFYSLIPFLSGFISKLIKKAVSPDSAKKVKNPSVFSPSSSDIPETIIEDFGENQTKLISLMEAVKNLDTSKVKITSPIGNPINLTLDDVFEITIMHERRHFNQAKQILELPEFPK